MEIISFSIFFLVSMEAPSVFTPLGSNTAIVFYRSRIALVTRINFSLLNNTCSIWPRKTQIRCLALLHAHWRCNRRADLHAAWGEWRTVHQRVGIFRSRPKSVDHEGGLSRSAERPAAVEQPVGVQNPYIVRSRLQTFANLIEIYSKHAIPFPIVDRNGAPYAWAGARIWGGWFSEAGRPRLGHQETRPVAIRHAARESSLLSGWFQRMSAYSPLARCSSSPR